MRKLGVIGGLGPMATALFMRMVIEMTDARTDQQHIEMIIYNCPQIPDRTRYILGESEENPAPKLLEIGRELERQGVALIAIPCITSGYFLPELTGKIRPRIIDIVEETCRYLMQRGIRRAGLMATSGTVESRIFQRTFSGNGCQLICPTEEDQRKVMHLIYDNVKANEPVDLACFSDVSERLRSAGAEVIILGCTELSVIRDQYPIGAGYLDAMQLMAKCAVEECGTLRAEYRELITGGIS